MMRICFVCIDKRGIEKILELRKSNQQFIEEDKEAAKEKGISRAAAALESALRSARQAADSLFTESAKKKAAKLLEKAEEYKTGLNF